MSLGIRHVLVESSNRFHDSVHDGLRHVFGFFSSVEFAKVERFTILHAYSLEWPWYPGAYGKNSVHALNADRYHSRTRLQNQQTGSRSCLSNGAISGPGALGKQN